MEGYFETDVLDLWKNKLNIEHRSHHETFMYFYVKLFILLKFRAH